MFQCFIVLSLVCWVFACNSGVETTPKNDIFIEYNNSLEITCCINPTIGNYTSLVFRRGNTFFNETYAKFLNNTCILFNNPRPEFQTANYFCHLKEDEGVFCSNMVTVDIKPRKIESFDCSGNDFINFNCSWIIPKIYAKVFYHVKLQTIIGNTTIDSNSIKENRYNNFKKYSFILKDAEYRRSIRNFTFYITGSNCFGNTTEKHPIDHFAKIIPSAPAELNYTDKTAHSVVLTWRTSENFNFFLNYSIDHKVQYSTKKNDTWIDADLEHLELNKINEFTSMFRLNLSNLPYAYKKYDVRVYYKSKYANDQYLSQFSSVIFTTLSELPKKPPITMAGSFAIASSSPKRGFYIYWKQIDDDEKNGDNFTYIAHDLNSNRNSTNLTSSYAFFTDEGLKPLNISIKSCNAVGCSTDTSFLFVPRSKDILYPPTQFTKFVYGNGTYNLSWKVPSDTKSKLKNYTLFWCYNEYEMPQKCNGKMDFVTVPSKQNSKQINLPVNKSLYQFAISANSENSSSGMIWSTCSVSEEDGAKVKITKATPIDSDTILLNWTLDCVYLDNILHGFNISYCIGDDGAHCLFSESEIINDPNATSHYIRKLEPRTTYSFKLSPITKKGMGTFYSIESQSTLEGTPSEPQNVTIFDLGNTSMTVKWDPPKYERGIISEYVIYLNSSEFNETIPVSLTNDPYEFNIRTKLITSLKSYTYYTIYMTASTSRGTSSPSSPIHLRTAIGPPSNIANPALSKGNVGEINFTWNPPAVPGGPKNIYEVKVHKEDLLLETVNTSQTFYTMKFMCANLKFTVRAINWDNDDPHYGAYSNNSAVHFLHKEGSAMLKYEGNWSETVMNTCPIDHSQSTWIGCTLFLILFLSFTVFGSRKICSFIRTMLDLKPEIPFLEDSKSCSEKQEMGEKQSDKMQLLSHADSLKSAPKTLSGSTESTDSSTLSWSSKVLIDKVLKDSPSSSNKSSKPLKNDENDLILQKNSHNQDLTSSSKKSEEPKFIFNRATGYVTQNETIKPTESETNIDTLDEYPPEYGRVVEAYDDKNSNIANTLLKPQLKLITKPVLPTSTEQVKISHPQTNLIEHTNALLNKHKNIGVANSREDDIITDPNMPSYVYSRFSWMTEKGLNNLDAVMGTPN